MLKLFCNLLSINSQRKLSLIKIKFLSIYIKLLSLLLKQGFIRGFYLDFCNGKKVIFILLKYVNDENFFKFKYLQQVNFETAYCLKSTHFIMFSTKKGVFFDTNIIDIKGVPLIQITIA